MAVESFVFYRSFMESIAEMRPKDQLATFWAIARYALEDEEPELPSAMTRAVFHVMRANLDANKQRRVNGKRGGRTKEPMVTQEETNGFEEENRRFADSEPNETENETENENVTENKKQTDNSPKGRDTRKKEKPVKHKYGQYDNVLLTDEELAKLKQEFPYDWQRRIENLSEYIASTGKGYKNHLATIRNWARRDDPAKPFAEPPPPQFDFERDGLYI